MTGQLVDRATGTPVAGGFLTLIDSGGLEVARVLTGNGGTFLLRAPAAGMYRLRSKRIGFWMWESASLMLTDSQTVHFRLELEAVPVGLPAVVVSPRPQCGTRGEHGTAVAQLWEEAREALAAVRWTLDEAAYRYTLERFDRERPAVCGSAKAVQEPARQDLDAGATVSPLRRSARTPGRSSPPSRSRFP